MHAAFGRSGAAGSAVPVTRLTNFTPPAPAPAAASTGGALRARNAMRSASPSPVRRQSRAQAARSRSADDDDEDGDDDDVRGDDAYGADDRGGRRGKPRRRRDYDYDYDDDDNDDDDDDQDDDGYDDGDDAAARADPSMAARVAWAEGGRAGVAAAPPHPFAAGFAPPPRAAGTATFTSTNTAGAGGFSAAEPTMVPGYAAGKQGGAAARSKGAAVLDIDQLEAMRILVSKLHARERAAKKKLRDERDAHRETKTKLEVAARAGSGAVAAATGAPLQQLLGARAVDNAMRNLVGRKYLELRHALVNADDPDNDELDGDEAKDVGAAKRLALACGRCFEGLQRRAPLSGMVNNMQLQFGEGIGTFFRFFRIEIYLMFPLLVVWLWPLMLHFANPPLYTGFTIAGVYIPTDLLFSAWDGTNSSLVFAYSICVFVFVPYTAIALGVLLSSQDKEQKYVSWLTDADDNATRHLSAVLGLWDHSIVGDGLTRDSVLASVQLLRRLQADDERREQVAKRTQAERARLFLRRLIGFLLNIVIVLCGAAGIVAVKWNEAIIQDLLQLPELIETLLLAFTVAFINAAFPIGIRAVVNGLQRWDEPAFALKVSTAWLYVLQMTNFVVLMLSFAPKLVPSLSGISILEPLTSTSVSGQCAMDAAGAVVIQLLAVDFVTFNGVQFVMSLLKTIVARIRGTRAQITFEISAMTVRVIYTQLLWWSLLPFAPVMAFFAVGAPVLSFLWTYLMVSRFVAHTGQPWNSKDTGRFFLILSIINLIVATGIVYTVLNQVTRVNCGLQSGTTALSAALVTSIQDGYVTDILYDVITNGWVLFSAVALLAIWLVLRGNTILVLGVSLIAKQQQFQQKQEAHAAQVRRLRAKLETARLQLRERDIDEGGRALVKKMTDASIHSPR